MRKIYSLSARLLCSLLLSMFLFLGATPMWGETRSFRLVTSASDLVDNGNYILVSTNTSVGTTTYYVMRGENSTSNRGGLALASGPIDNVITLSEWATSGNTADEKKAKAHIVQLKASSTNWNIYDEAEQKYYGGGYTTVKSGKSSNNNHFKLTGTTPTTESGTGKANGVFVITMENDNTAAIKNENNFSVRFNYNSGTPIFATYSSGQTAVYLYKEVPAGPTKLSAPTNLSSSNVTTNSATLSWDAVEHASSYTVKIDDTEYPNATSPYSATGLSSNTEYTWTVQAVGDGTNYTTSDNADSKSFTTLAPATAHTVTFNVGTNGSFKDGEEFVNDNQRVEASAGAGVALPEVVANPGFVFGGWSASDPATSTYVAVDANGKYHPSDNVTLNAYYKVIPATPTFGPAAGMVEAGTEVTISCTTEGATIYYTTNGDEPTASSTPYSSAIVLTAGQTIKAIAVKEDVSSSVASATYTIATHTARFSINGVILDANNSVVAKGEAITFPANPADLDDFKFQGWTKTQNYSDAKNAPSDLCKSATMGTEDVTFYAVYANGEEGEPTLTKLGSGATFAEGDKIVVMAKSGDNWYGLNMVALSGSYVDYFVLDHEVAISDITETTQYVTLSASTDSKWNLGHATNGYLYSSGSNSLTLSTTNKSDFVIKWDDTNKGFSIKFGSRWLACRSDLTDNSGENQYKYRLGGTGSSSLGVGYFSLYKYASGEPTYSNYCTKISESITLTNPTEGEYGFATFCGEANYTVSGAKAYKAELSNNNELSLTELTGVIPAGDAEFANGVIIAGEVGATATITYTSKEATAEIDGNILLGTTEPTATADLKGSNTYLMVLNKTTNNFGSFEGAELPANKACFAYSAPSAAPVRILMPGVKPIPTEINNNEESVKANKTLIDGRLYILRDGNMFDLNGRLVK